jgi:hypothetical protein
MAALFLFLKRGRYRPQALQHRTSKKQGLAIALAKATIASPHHHEEPSSWRLQAYQEYTARAIFIHDCQAPLDYLRATEEICGCLFLLGHWVAEYASYGRCLCSAGSHSPHMGQMRRLGQRMGRQGRKPVSQREMVSTPSSSRGISGGRLL